MNNVDNLNLNLKKNIITNDELVLVVKRDYILKNGSWQGLKKFNDKDDNFSEKSYLNMILEKKEFHPRSLMEQDENYKQIIPYLIFKYNDKVFLMQRNSNSTESRLKNKFTFGIGGHINESDIKGESIFDWSKREFEEEVHYNGNYTIDALGIINDDHSTVGKVHLGFVFILNGDNQDIKVKSELKSGNLYTKEECKIFFDNLESWSQMVFDYIF